MTNDLKQRVTDEMVEAAFYANHDERIPPSKIERETVRRSIEAALSVSSSGEAVVWQARVRSRAHVDDLWGQWSGWYFWYGDDQQRFSPNNLVEREYRALVVAHPSPLSVQTGVAIEWLRHELAIMGVDADAKKLVAGILSALSSAPAPSVELRGALEVAYGLLWKDSSGSAWSHEARKVLLAHLDRDGQKRGIEHAMRQSPAKHPMGVTGIWLKNIGEQVIVEAEIEGRWIEVIRERSDGAYSHIVEPGGILKAYLTAPNSDAAGEGTR